jgi:hypothetical protein
MQPCPASEPLLTFRASDGWSFSHSIVIAADGRADVEYSTHFGPGLRFVQGQVSFQVRPRTLARAVAAFDAAHFASLANAFLPLLQGADLPSYSITYCGKNVYVDGFAIEEHRVPARLVRVIDLLSELVGPHVERAVAAS